MQVARTLFQNPTEYARLVEASDESDKEFKIHQDFTTMKSFLKNTCLGEKVASKPQPSAKRSILELYDSSEDELNQEPPKKKHFPVYFDILMIPSLLMLTGSLHALIFMCTLLYAKSIDVCKASSHQGCSW